MYVDVKMSIWQRISLSSVKELDREKIVEALKEGCIHSLWELEKVDVDWENLVETEELFPIDKNDNNPTIKLLDNEFNVIWDNSICKQEQQVITLQN